MASRKGLQLAWERITLDKHISQLLRLGVSHFEQAFRFQRPVVLSVVVFQLPANTDNARASCCLPAQSGSDNAALRELMRIRENTALSTAPGGWPHAALTLLVRAFCTSLPHSVLTVPVR